MHLDAVLAANVDLGLTRFEIAEILGASAGLVDAWLDGSAYPGRHFEERIEELGAVADMVADRMTPRSAQAWLSMPCPELDYYAPIDVLRRGELATVVRVVEAMTTTRFGIGGRPLADGGRDEAEGDG